jgi:biopolymer transport protein ExbB
MQQLQQDEALKGSTLGRILLLAKSKDQNEQYARANGSLASRNWPFGKNNFLGTLSAVAPL